MRKRLGIAIGAVLLMGGCVAVAGGEDKPKTPSGVGYTALPEASRAPASVPTYVAPTTTRAQVAEESVRRERLATPTTTRKAVAPTTRRTTQAPAKTYYANCAAVRAAGAAPIYRGQPGYGSHLDRDGDGKACEPKR